MTDTSNGYVCFYKDQRIEVHADTSANAQISAYNILKGMYPRRKIKAWEITVMLAERSDGTAVVHSTQHL